ncbi:MAG: hypothetical protein AB1414_19855 [bacterium]
MSKKIMLVGLGVWLSSVSALAYAMGGFLFGKSWRSDSISYHAPCWGENNKIYFIKKVTFAVESENPDLVTGGTYFIHDVKYFLCSMNYDGTEKKEIVEIFTKKARKMYKRKYKNHLEIGGLGLGKPYMDYCKATHKLVYNLEDTGIWTINIDGTNERCISSDGAHPSWSPDGKKIVYRMHIKKEKRRKDGFLEGYEDYDSLWVMDADGSNKNKILSEEVDIWITSPIWSPKGDLIAFTCKGWIWVMKPDGSERRRVIESPHLAGWTLEGKMLLVGGNRIVNLDGEVIDRPHYWGKYSLDGNFVLNEIDMIIYDSKNEKVLPRKEPFPVHEEHFVYKKPNNIW